MYAFSLSPEARPTTSAVSLSVLVACTAFSFLGIFHAGLSHPSYFETIMSPPTPQSNVKIRDTSAANLDVSHAAKASPDTRSRRLLDIAENSTTTPGFQWEYLDLKRNGTCGYRKCFFYSSTEETEGYLVARPIKDDYLPRMLRIEKETKRLEKKYNIRHFSIESPQNVGVPPKKILKKLNKLAVGPKKTSSYYGSTKKEKYNATNSSLAFGLVVQKVKIAPTPSLIVRCAFFKQKGKVYFDDHSATKEDFRSAVDDKASFVSIFDGELKQLIKLLGKESRLWRDFQFMIDPRGRIHHLDLDRMEMDTFRLPSSQGAQTCLSSAITTVVKILLDERNATLVATSRR